jgi:hypothetical protein
MAKSVFKIVGLIFFMLLGVAQMTSLANNPFDLSDQRTDYNFDTSEYTFQILKNCHSFPFGQGNKNESEEENEKEQNEENENEDEVEKNEKRKRLGFSYSFTNQIAFLQYFQICSFVRQAGHSLPLNWSNLPIYLRNHNFRN